MRYQGMDIRWDRRHNLWDRMLDMDELIAEQEAMMDEDDMETIEIMGDTHIPIHNVNAVQALGRAQRAEVDDYVQEQPQVEAILDQAMRNIAEAEERRAAHRVANPPLVVADADLTDEDRAALAAVHAVPTIGGVARGPGGLLSHNVINDGGVLDMGHRSDVVVPPTWRIATTDPAAYLYSEVDVGVPDTAMTPGGSGSPEPIDVQIHRAREDRMRSVPSGRCTRIYVGRVEIEQMQTFIDGYNEASVDVAAGINDGSMEWRGLKVIWVNEEEHLHVC